ncbi:MAG: sigma factor-like helix-turn-helix DNA-binding protein [Terracidiphilus sp.]|jgi:RNA polymerase sigma-70 factor (ECF subfamily)
MVSSKPADLDLPVPCEKPSTAAEDAATPIPALPQSLVQELWSIAEAETCGLSVEEFGGILQSVGERVNYGLPPGVLSDTARKATFFRSLHLCELALAHGCALGRELAWERFLRLYRAPLTHAAIAITGSATLGQELADSVYAELFGLRSRDGQRTSPLASYTGRGSLLGWLRTTLAQRSVDRHRRTYREAPLDGFDAPAPAPALVSAQPGHLEVALARTLRSLGAEDRYLLSAYYLDRQTLLEVGRILGVHEATISRRLKRLLADLRKRLLQNLQSGGLSKRAAEEALGADPRDIEINLRALLQTSQTGPFFDQKAGAATASESL